MLIVNRSRTLDKYRKQSSAFVASLVDLQRLVDIFREQNFSVLGPTVIDHAVCYDKIESIDQLPSGWRESQDGGRYRLIQEGDGALFAHTMGPHSWKRFLFPANQDTVCARQESCGIALSSTSIEPAPSQVFLGVRACEIAALKILDKVLLEGPFVDSVYRERRRNSFIVAVNCTRAGDTCFCASMNTGPYLTDGFDLGLTELLEANQHLFIIEAGTERGHEVVEGMGLPLATDEQRRTAKSAVDDAATSMGRVVDTENLPTALKTCLDDYHWEEIANRCLTCGNCTLVCPTCFCSNYEDSSDLVGATASRTRRWDSCFSVDFSYIHGGSTRATAMSRYRQWMMHKLAYWPEQFGSYGCVGCGRCITWCPVGIDITEEITVFRKRVTR